MNLLRQHTPVIALVVFLNLLLIGFIGKFGPILQIDTMNYFSAAYNFYRGNGLLMFDGNYLQNAPPFFAIILVPAYLFHIPEAVYICVVLGISFNLTVFFVYQLVGVLGLKSKIGATLLSMLFGFAWTHVWANALSEVLFVPLFVAWVYYSVTLDKNNWLKWALVLTFLVLTRYIGWFLLLGFLFHVLLGRKELQLSKLIYAILPALLFTTLWLLTNYWLNGQMLGEHSLAEKFSVGAIYLNFKSWIVALLSPQFKLNVAFLIFVVISSVFGIFSIIKPFEPTRELGLFLNLSLNLSIFTTALLFLQPGLSLVQLPRYISFFWPIFGVFTAFFIENRVSRAKISKILLISTLLCQIVLVFNWAKKHHQASRDQYLSHLYFSHILQKRSNFIDEKLLSNFPDLVWWLTKSQCLYTPFQNESESTFISRLGSNRRNTLIWFDNKERVTVMKSDLLEVLKEQNKKPYLLGQGFYIYQLDSNVMFY